MTMRSHSICSLVLAVLLVGAAGVQGHASSKLRGILGRDAPGSGQMEAIGMDHSHGSERDVPGDLVCPVGQTLKIASLDAAQNPSCVECGGHMQFACNGYKCKKHLMVLDTPSCVQPLCIPDGTTEPRKIKRTAKGKHFHRGGEATFSVTKDVACGWHGLPCCADASCDNGLVCSSNTCTVGSW